MNVLIVTPLKKEKQLLLQALSSLVEIHHDENRGIHFIKNTHHQFILVHSLAGPNFLTKIEEILLNLKKNQIWVDSVICCGSAGALSDSIQPKDIVIAPIKTNFLFKKNLELTKSNFKNLLIKIERDSIVVHHKVVDSEIIKKNLLQENQKALAVSCESLAHLKDPFLENLIDWRVVTDSADKKTAIDFNNNIEPAMKLLTETLCYFLLNLP